MAFSKADQVRGKKAKKPKKLTKTQINKKLDNEWRLAVYERGGNRCEYCLKTEHLNAHHIFSRANRSVRWDLDNGVCLCPLHHNFSHEMSAHKSPMSFAEWIISYRGQEWYNRLKLKAKSVSKE